LAERVVGSILGLALGDALGAPFEFRRAGEVPWPLPAFELPWTGLPAGSTTDDTALARNLVRSLEERNGLDPEDLVARHLQWFRTDPPHVGTLTRRVLRRVSRGEVASEAARAVWEERGPEVSAGNGSVMYCAPLGLGYAHRPDALPGLGLALSALTHYDERCGSAVVAVTLAAASLARGDRAEEAVGGALLRVQESQGGEELEFLVDAIGRSRRVDGPDQGFCLYAAGLGMQAILRPGGFEEELRRVVSLGGNTNANAAVAGALLGARDGVHGLPRDWLSRLRDRDAIRQEAEALVPLAGTGRPDGSTPPSALP
jgi:ADP-ribosyl-[dinitrogen reductase] hydrolase